MRLPNKSCFGLSAPPPWDTLVSDWPADWRTLEKHVSTLDPCTVVAGGSRVRSCFVSLISDVTFGECRGDEAETSTARAGQALGPHVSWWWECVGRCWGSALIRIRRCGSILLSELVLEKRP